MLERLQDPMHRHMDPKHFYVSRNNVCRLSLKNERSMRLKMMICSKEIELINLEDKTKTAESMFTFLIPSMVFKHV